MTFIIGRGSGWNGFALQSVFGGIGAGEGEEEESGHPDGMEMNDVAGEGEEEVNGGSMELELR